MKKRSILFAAAGALLCAAAAAANDFPTAQRVIYVQECVKNNPGPHFEMINKCSCALDALAREVKYDDYVTMSTVVNAMSIGGERGNDLRDNETLKPQLKRFRELQAQAQKSCFIAQK
ncbi:MAG TPA: hypothetical protein VF107_17715 [Burkholderiaceae bacterium]